MTASFSDPFLGLARPHLAWACEQLDLFEALVPVGTTSYDLDAPSVSRSGVTLRAHMIGSYALDGTWLWAWGNDHYRDRPAAARSRELREIGERVGVPELTEAMLDFNHFPNPRLAADHMLLICVGLLDGLGGTSWAFSERGWMFMVVDDPAVPRAEPRPAGLARALRNGAALVPGPALKPVRGWFKRHGVEPEYGPGRVAGTLPLGDRITVALEAEEVTGVEVTGADGGEPRSATLEKQELIGRQVVLERQFPPALLSVAARQIAFSIRRTRAVIEYAEDHLEFDGRPPRWDEEAGELRFPGGALAARRLGAYDLDEGWFAWAPDTGDIRARLAEEAGGADGLPELAGERLDLTRFGAPEAVAVTLARTAASTSGYAFSSLGNEFWAVTDERLPAVPDTDPQTATEEIRAGASWLRGITPATARDETTRSMATSYFERLGLQVWHYGQPDFLSGVLGLYEVRVYFAPDGTITEVSPGVLMAPRG
ncbi:DUF6882 domain-containing protein [Streptomyces sp. NBC_01803]|uniref:DUF6882 domain-containing protein n=1 Tax=Streptomyces sp. NBC_01803 TaxID=2975946 RepID=UPI002DDB2DD2|nr:DUF6882 domain-containing protein [Streptomyces sp. NBC_01803]WSA43071.1 hypothetical protein OIE51_01995 [Streptomyces sp. NBC_01803]